MNVLRRLQQGQPVTMKPPRYCGMKVFVLFNSQLMKHIHCCSDRTITALTVSYKHIGVVGLCHVCSLSIWPTTVGVCPFDDMLEDKAKPFWHSSSRLDHFNVNARHHQGYAKSNTLHRQFNLRHVNQTHVGSILFFWAVHNPESWSSSSHVACTSWSVYIPHFSSMWTPSHQ